MKFLYLVSAVFIIAAGCASSNNGDKQKQPANLVKLQQPKDQPCQPSTVYIDSVKQITSNKQPVLLVSGSLPDACTHLKEATHQIEHDSLKIKLATWRNPEKMCAQVLTSFSYIYDGLPEKELANHSQVYINGTSYPY